jgi:hypothetical protein
MVIINVRDKLSVSKQTEQKFDMERFSLNKLSNSSLPA